MTKSKTKMKTIAQLIKKQAPGPTGSHEKTSGSEVMGINKSKRIFFDTANSLHPGYTIDEENKTVIQALLKYFTGNPDFETSMEFPGLSLRKGILLAGNIGTGKSMLMGILRDCRLSGKHFGIKPCRELAQNFALEGVRGIELCGLRAVRYVNGRQKIGHMLFDDLGAEKPAVYYGNTVNVMEEILLDRYEHFIKHGLLTHITTNKDLSELEALYGSRVVSRMHEMFNFLVLGGEQNSKDRRIN